MADRHERYDPRMGDEYEGEQEQTTTTPPSLAANPPHHHHPADRHVRLVTEPRTLKIEIERAQTHPSDETDATRVDKPEETEKDKESRPPSRIRRILSAIGATIGKIMDMLLFNGDLSWVKSNFTWSKIKPALRCAVMGWVCILFVIIDKLAVMCGAVRPCLLRYSEQAD